MSYYSGQNGRMFLKAADSDIQIEVGRLQNWSISFSENILDTTCLQDKDRTIPPGVRSFTGQASMFYYRENDNNVRVVTREFIKTGNDDYSGKEFGKSAPAPKPVFIRLRLDGENNADIEFYAVVNSFTLTCSVGEVVSAEVGWEGHGPVKQFNL